MGPSISKSHLRTSEFNNYPSPLETGKLQQTTMFLNTKLSKPAAYLSSFGASNILSTKNLHDQGMMYVIWLLVQMS